jgi:hypothetical protein
MIDQEELAVRHAALAMAREVVTPVIEDHPLEAYEISGPSNIFASGSNTTKTPAEQNVDLLIDIASWLVKD